MGTGLLTVISFVLNNPGMDLLTFLKAERGRAKTLADVVGVSEATISEWANKKKSIALDHCPAIQDFTGGAVTCEELRPDKADYFALIRAQAVVANAQGAVTQPQGA